MKYLKEEPPSLVMGFNAAENCGHHYHRYYRHYYHSLSLLLSLLLSFIIIITDKIS